MPIPPALTQTLRWLARATMVTVTLAAFAGGDGRKAAFVPTTPQVLAVVQRSDGVARIVGNNLTKAQITAVARAVAAP